LKIFALVVFLFSLGTRSALAQHQSADLIIQGGTIYDGSEDAKGYAGDVVIRGDKILYVGPKALMKAERTIDAKGMIVAPGFIDGHTHADHFLDNPDPQQRQAPAWLMQGVSTILIGIDGNGVPEVKNRFDKFKQQGIGTNVAMYVGYEPIRQRIIGNYDRPPTYTELEAEKELVAQGMCEGALGFSTNLAYAPQNFGKTDEIIQLAREAGRRGGLYDTHQRDEASYSIGLLSSIREVLEIGRDADIPVHISHIKALGPDTWGKSGDVISLVDQARAAGQTVTANVYSYLAIQTLLSSILMPHWAMDGGYAAMLRRFDDPATLGRIREEMQDNLRRENGAQSILFTTYGQPWSGKSLEQVAAEWRIDPVDAAIRIMRQSEMQYMVAFGMIQSDVDNFIRQPWVVSGSDGFDGHPRQYANFTNEYVNYVRKRSVISLGFFIRHSTGLSGDIYKLDRRGYLKPGYYADIVVFDPMKYAPKADFIHWDRLSEGVNYLVVNGKLAVDGGKMTGVLSGRPLPHTPTQGTCL
jgi:N-acyl-D-aspartate/D-glutamate deacylase